jgi:hypothetical protein
MGRNIDIKGIEPDKRLFHNERLNVYPRKIHFEKIWFWPDNYRTLLHLDILKAEKKKPLSELTLSEITDFLVGREELRLYELASSIEKNGVKVPLIILNDGLLLDGNRRYFACSYIFDKAQKKQQGCPDILKEIPVLVIKTTDVNETIKRKILAEANFVEEYKVPWSLDVKAKVTHDFYLECIKNKLTPEEAYDEIQKVYSVKKKDVDAYLETMKLTDEFIASAPPGKKNEFRVIVQNKFVYFWEFRNKGLRGAAALDPKKELPSVKKLFFKMIETVRFKNLKQVEPMIRAVRDPHAWELLTSSNGIKIDVVEALIREQRVFRSAEDKVRNFLRWLQTKADPKTFTKATSDLLKKLVDVCSKLLSRKGA